MPPTPSLLISKDAFPHNFRTLPDYIQTNSHTSHKSKSSVLEGSVLRGSILHDSVLGDSILASSVLGYLVLEDSMQVESILDEAVQAERTCRYWCSRVAEDPFHWANRCGHGWAFHDLSRLGGFGAEGIDLGKDVGFGEGSCAGRSALCHSSG
jgi:hypothetical protein